MKNFRDTIYDISEDGKIFNRKSGLCLKTYFDKDGYEQITIMIDKKKRKRFSVHRLVAFTYLGETENMHVNHIDGNKLNNNFKNLEWTTLEENNLHAKTTGLIKQSFEHPNCKLDPLSLLTIYTMFISGKRSRKDLSTKFRISEQGISRICTGQNYSGQFRSIFSDMDSKIFFKAKNSLFKDDIDTDAVNNIVKLRGDTTYSISLRTGHSSKMVKKVLSRFDNRGIDNLYISLNR